MPENEKVGKHFFPTPKWVYVGSDFIEIKGFEFYYQTSTTESQTIIDLGKQLAILILKSLDGGIDQKITKEDIRKYAFSENGEVIKRETWTQKS